MIVLFIGIFLVLPFGFLLFVVSADPEPMAWPFKFYREWLEEHAGGIPEFFKWWIAMDV
jgi:hypothetical protein